MLEKKSDLVLVVSVGDSVTDTPLARPLRRQNDRKARSRLFPYLAFFYSLSLSRPITLLLPPSSSSCSSSSSSLLHISPSLPCFSQLRLGVDIDIVIIIIIIAGFSIAAGGSGPTAYPRLPVETPLRKQGRSRPLSLTHRPFVALITLLGVQAINIIILSSGTVVWKKKSLRPRNLYTPRKLNVSG
jgi:hypothetical protein